MLVLLIHIFHHEKSIELTKYLILRFSKFIDFTFVLIPLCCKCMTDLHLEGILKNRRDFEWLIKFFKNNRVHLFNSLTSPFFTNTFMNLNRMKYFPMVITVLKVIL